METRTLSAKDFKKEINFIPIERMVETRGQSLEQKEKYAEQTLFERKLKTDEHKLNILDEIEDMRHKKMVEKIDRMRLEKGRQEALRNHPFVNNLKVYAVRSTIVLAILATAFVLKKQMDYVNSPVVVVTDDMLANVGLKETDNGRPVDTKKFDRNNIEETYQYILDNNIESEDIKEEIRNSCVSDDEYEFAIEKINEMYPELELSIEKSKGL